MARTPKTVFIGLDTLKLGVTEAVICFNDGATAKANVIERHGINPVRFMLEEMSSG